MRNDASGVWEVASAVLPVLVVGGPALLGALLPEDVLGLDDGGHEVVLLEAPLHGERPRARELHARVAVVRQRVPLRPRPDVPLNGMMYGVLNALYK